MLAANEKQASKAVSHGHSSYEESENKNIAPPKKKALNSCEGGRKKKRIKKQRRRRRQWCFANRQYSRCVNPRPSVFSILLDLDSNQSSFFGQDWKENKLFSGPLCIYTWCFLWAFYRLLFASSSSGSLAHRNDEHRRWWILYIEILPQFPVEFKKKNRNQNNTITVNLEFLQGSLCEISHHGSATSPGG